MLFVVNIAVTIPNSPNNLLQQGVLHEEHKKDRTRVIRPYVGMKRVPGLIVTLL
jgi:hypothetical protein